jgi:hypothetical protein
VTVVVKKERRCTECKRQFATPESYRSHKYKFGGCRSLEALAAAGFIETGKGWKYTRLVGNK